MTYTGTYQATPFTIGATNNLVSTFFPGYISNLRVVVGVAVYTGVFTPPTQPLQKTQLAGTNIAAITNAANTSLLLSTLYNDAFKDLSDNNFTITATASPTSTVQHPFNPNGYYSYQFLTGGANSYISMANTVGTITTGPFTIEAWIQPTSYVTEGKYLSNIYWQSGQNGGWAMYITSTQIGLLASNSTFNAFTYPIVITRSAPLNTWTHIAVTRNSSNLMTLYVDGVSVNTATYANSLNLNSGGTQTGWKTYVGAALFDGAFQTNEAFYGYISNARIANSTCIYTSNFAPLTAPFVANSSIALLTCQSPTLKDNSPANNAITTSATSPRISNIQPFDVSFANTGLAISKQYSNGALQTVGQLDELALNTNLNGSVFFTAASAQLLSLPSSGGFVFGTGDFTIEFWANWAIVGASAPGNVITTNINTTGLSIYITNSALNIARLNVAADLAVSVSQVTGRWDHYAFVRISGTAYIYKNGVLIGSGVVSTNYAQNGLTIGTDLNRSGYTTGYLSNVRIVKGIGVYTGAFTPPTRSLNTLQPAAANTAALTDASRTSLLLRTLKTNVYDDSIYNAAITKLPAATPTPSTKQNPFLSSNTGYFSGFFNGSSRLTTATNAAFTFGTGDFTIETWIYQTISSVSNYMIIVQDNLYSSAGGWALYSYNNGLNFWKGGASQTELIAPAGTIPLNTWTHVALSRSSGSNRVFINGAQVGATASDSTNYTGTNLIIGSNPTTLYYFPGFMADFRVVKGFGVSSITVPTAPLTANSSTSLLTCQSSAFRDNSPNGFTVTATGATVSNSITPFDSILSNTAPTIVANTTLRKQFSNGTIQIINDFDEYTSIS
jgi:hypothetical protein